jgi:hypothetical protein
MEPTGPGVLHNRSCPNDNWDTGPKCRATTTIEAQIMSTGATEKVDYRIEYRPWPAGKEFPLTPLEAWYVM